MNPKASDMIRRNDKCPSFLKFPLLIAAIAVCASMVQTAWAGWTINDTQTKDTDWSQASSWVDIASGASKTGKLTNNYTGTVTIGQNFDVGRSGKGAKGEYVQNAGTVNVGTTGADYNLIIGYQDALTADVVIAGGTMNVSNSIELPKNSACTSSLEVRGGTLNVGKYLYLRKGTVTIDSGTVNITNDVKMGDYGDATLTINGGTMTVGPWTRFENTSYAKTINLNGGTLETYYVNSQGTSGSQTVLFNGGTLKKRKSSDYSLIHANIAAKVGANGGTINANNFDTTIEANFSDNDASAPGGMKFCGGGNVTLSGSIGYTGGTTIAAGTTVKVDTAAKKDAILGSGVGTLKFIPSATGTFTFVTITGDGEFADNDLLKVSVAPNAAGSAVFSISDDRKSLQANVTYAGGAINQSTPTLVFPGATLADLATHTLRARMGGDWVSDKGAEATFFNRTETMDGGVLTKVTYQLQMIDGSVVKAVKVEFTEDANGVYAKLVDGNYSNYSGDGTTLNMFGNEPLDANAGTSLYIPYDLQLVAPANAISVNFAYNAGEFNTSSSVRYGAGDYAVPYSSWNNMTVSAGSSATFGGATFKQTTTSGRYRCSDLSPSKDLRYGYLDDSGLTVVVDVTNIPYEFYRIVTYHATDNADKKFGHVTINGVDYMGVTDATVKGNSTWGITGAANKANGLREGVNYLVSDVMTDTAVTITGHRDKSSGPTARGCIAAIQIVEYLPTTYTATIGDGGAKTFSTLDWDKTLPAALTAGDQVVLNVNEDTTLTFDSALDVYAIRFNVADGKTLTLAGSNVLAQYITATGAGQTVVASASQLAGTVKGDGTLVYDGFKPTDATFTDAQWTGTVWVKNIATDSNERKDWTLANYGNAGSAIRFTNVNLYFATGTTSFAGTVDIDGAGLNVCDGYGGAIATIARLTGDGTLSTGGGSANGNGLTVNDASGFTGTMTLTKYKVVVGTATDTSASGVLQIDSGRTVTIAAGKTWTAPGGMVLDGTLNLGAGTTVPAIVSGTGTVSVADGTGTLNGYREDAALALATASGATLVIVDAGRTSMTVGALDNQGTIDLTGTALTEATLNLASGATAATTGTILYPATFEKLVVSPADLSMRSLAAFTAIPTLPTGAAYYVTVAETREEFGRGSMTVGDIASGVNVRVARPNGTFIDVAPVDGTVTLTEAPQIAGAATAFDATYTNTVEYAYRAPGWNAGSGQDVKPPTYNNTANDETTGMYILHHPWVSGVMANVNELGDFTLVVVGKMSPSPSTQFLHIGSSTSGNMGLLITTTENADEVLIAKNTGNVVDAAGGVKASVPNAATARHAYVINKRGTVFEVWVDGVKRGQFDVGDGFVLGSTSSCGIQVGSDISGSLKNAGIYKGVPNEPETETGVINVLRLFDYSITDAQAAAVFATYPYVSQGGLYTRTVAADGTFSETGAWAKDGAEGTFDVPEGATVDGVLYNPDATLTANAASEIEVNADVALETFTVGGSAALTFAADGEHTVTVVGAAVVNVPVTAEYGALNMSGAPVQLGANGAICFDCSGFDISEVFTTTRFQLTGLIDRNDAKVTFVPPAAVLSRSVSFGYNATGSCYEFTVTAERTAGTVYYKSGTFAAGSADLRVVTLDGEGNETETVLFPGDNVVFDDAVAGANAVVQFGEPLPANVTFSFEDWTGKVVPVLPSSMYVWTGETGDGKANTPGNWYGGATPPAGAAVYIPAKAAAIDNDIAGFAPASITFGYGIGAVAIGGNAITGVAAVTNLAVATHDISAPVHFADKVSVVQNAKSYESKSSSSVRFSGGVYGTEIDADASHFMNGAYHLDTGAFGVQGSDNRYSPGDNSSLTIAESSDTSEIVLGEDSSSPSVLTAGVVRTSGRLSCYCNAPSEYVVTNELVMTLPGADRFVAYRYSDGAFKFEKVTIGDQGVSKWFYFANSGDYSYEKNIWIGSGGLNFADGASADTAYSCGLRADDVINLRPWYSDYTIATKAGSTADLVIHKETHIGTDDESGVARTVTCDGLISQGGAAFVEGAGTFVVNNPGNNHTGTWTIKDTATVAVKPGCKTGTGAVTVNAGATLAVSASGTVAHGGALTLEAGAVLGFNFTEKDAAPVLDVTDKTVTVNGAVKVKVSSAGDIKPMGGKYVLTSGGKFTGREVSPAAGTPKWVKSVSVNDDGDIVLVVKPSGVAIFIR